MSAPPFTVAVVLPTRNPGRFWPEWLAGIAKQRTTAAGLVIDSSSDDGTDFDQRPESFRLFQIAQENFNHGGTRNLALRQLPPGTEIVVFMTQDAFLTNADDLRILVSTFKDPGVAGAYGRQRPHWDANPLAKHAREFSYPSHSYVVCLEDKARLGLRACFMSNSFAAYRLADLEAIGGFSEDVILGEDMTAAARLLMAGKRIAYAAEACAYHSHNYTVRQEFCRYFDTGVFHARSPWLLQTFGGAGGEGLRFVRSELAHLWQHAPGWIPSALLRTAAKWCGYRLGRMERALPLWIKRWCSMHKVYWGLS